MTFILSCNSWDNYEFEFWNHLTNQKKFAFIIDLMKYITIFQKNNLGNELIINSIMNWVKWVI